MTPLSVLIVSAEAHLSKNPRRIPKPTRNFPSKLHINPVSNSRRVMHLRSKLNSFDEASQYLESQITFVSNSMFVAFLDPVLEQSPTTTNSFENSLHHHTRRIPESTHAFPLRRTPKPTRSLHLFSMSNPPSAIRRWKRKLEGLLYRCCPPKSRRTLTSKLSQKDPIPLSSLEAVSYYSPIAGIHLSTVGIFYPEVN